MKANTHLRANAVITEDADGYLVEVFWTGTKLDRPNTGGWGLGLKHKTLVERLARAIDAQAVHIDPKVAVDVNGKTYVAAWAKVNGRTMNADLKKLGF